MPVFFCRVVTKEGRTTALIREAPSEEILIRELSRDAIYPVKVLEARETALRIARGKRFSRAAVLEFTNTIALLLSSGLTFKDSLEIAQTIFLKGRVNEIVVCLLEEIQKGRSVYQALSDFGSSFPPIFKGFTKIGEKIGSLEGTFKQLSEYLREEKKIKDKLASSLIYPVLVLSVAVIGITGVVIFVFPRIKEMFYQLGALLPQRLESMLRLLNNSIVVGAVLIGVLAIGIVLVLLIKRRNTAFSEKIDRLLLKLPVVGRLRYLKEVLNLLFTMETLTEGGFTIEEALTECEKVISNRAIRSGILQARESIMKGENLSRAFLASSIFPERLGRWIAIGERSGQIEQVFTQLRHYYQGEIEKWSSRFMNLIEPILILIVGIIIFIIIYFFITPIFSIYEGLY